MDNAQKAIMLGVGLFITIIVIAAVMAITGIGQDLIGQGQSQLSGISGQLATQVQASYDQVRMSGTQVKSAINKYYNDSNLAVYLITDPTANASGLKLDTSTAGTGTAAAPYMCSMMYIKPTDTVTVDGNQNTLKSVTVAKGSLESVTGAARVPLSTITSAIGSTAQYKSVLITNQATGNIVGILFQRYQ